MAANALPQAELLQRLTALADSLGANAAALDDHTLTGTFTAITSQWWLGGRKAASHFTCTIDAVGRKAHFRDSACETVWGLPPPVFVLHSSRQSGARVNDTRSLRGFAGRCTLAYGNFRERVARVVTDAGWEFSYEVT